MIDLKNSLCVNCNSGTYIETGLMDDIAGVVHCDYCGLKVDRYAPDMGKEPSGWNWGNFDYNRGFEAGYKKSEGVIKIKDYEIKWLKNKIEKLLNEGLK